MKRRSFLRNLFGLPLAPPLLGAEEAPAAPPPEPEEKFWPHVNCRRYKPDPFALGSCSTRITAIPKGEKCPRCGKGERKRKKR